MKNFAIVLDLGKQLEFFIQDLGKTMTKQFRPLKTIDISLKQAPFLPKELQDSLASLSRLSESFECIFGAMSLFTQGIMVPSPQITEKLVELFNDRPDNLGAVFDELEMEVHWKGLSFWNPDFAVRKIQEIYNGTHAKKASGKELTKDKKHLSRTRTIYLSPSMIILHNRKDQRNSMIL